MSTLLSISFLAGCWDVKQANKENEFHAFETNSNWTRIHYNVISFQNNVLLSWGSTQNGLPTLICWTNPHILREKKIEYKWTKSTIISKVVTFPFKITWGRKDNCEEGCSHSSQKPFIKLMLTWITLWRDTSPLLCQAICEKILTQTNGKNICDEPSSDLKSREKTSCQYWRCLNIQDWRTIGQNSYQIHHLPFGLRVNQRLCDRQVACDSSRWHESFYSSAHFLKVCKERQRHCPPLGKKYPTT